MLTMISSTGNLTIITVEHASPMRGPIRLWLPHVLHTRTTIHSGMYNVQYTSVTVQYLYVATVVVQLSAMIGILG